MLTKEDLKNLAEIFATKDHIDKKFDGFREDFSNLQSSVDGYAKKADTYFQEMLTLSHRLERHEKWIQQIAEKIGVKLDY